MPKNHFFLLNLPITLVLEPEMVAKLIPLISLQLNILIGSCNLKGTKD